MSSALIPYGMSIRLFEQPDLQGESITLREDTPTIQLAWNDRAASMVVEASPVAFWKTSNRNISILGESSESNNVRATPRQDCSIIPIPPLPLRDFAKREASVVDTDDFKELMRTQQVRYRK